MHKTNFTKLLRAKLTIIDYRLYKHDNHSNIEQVIFLLIVGYKMDFSNNMLFKSPVFQSILDKEQLTSQSSISHLWNRLSHINIRQFQEVNQLLIDKARTARNKAEKIFNLDSIYSDTFRSQ